MQEIPDDVKDIVTMVRERDKAGRDEESSEEEDEPRKISDENDPHGNISAGPALQPQPPIPHNKGSGAQGAPPANEDVDMTEYSSNEDPDDKDGEGDTEMRGLDSGNLRGVYGRMSSFVPSRGTSGPSLSSKGQGSGRVGPYGGIQKAEIRRRKPIG
jgi:hypothetical protein